MKKIIGAMCLLVLTLSTRGQNSNLVEYSEETMLDDRRQVHYIRLKEGSRVDEKQVEHFINTKIFSAGRNKVSLLNTERDNIGFTHLRFTIRQNDAQLANKMIIAHCKEGKLVSLNGDLADISAASNSFIISENSALQSALKKVNANKYKWQNTNEEQHMKKVLDQPDFTYYPHGSKTILEKDGRSYSAWVFNIYAESPLYRANVYVDASTGLVLEEQNLICTSDVPGTAATKYNGTQTITCDQNGSVFQLKETSRGLGIETYNLNGSMTYSTSTDFTHTAATFTMDAFDQGALDAHWGAEKTYDYFNSQHNRNSIDNAGFKLLSFIHYDTFYSNAFWDGQRMTYGDGNGITSIFTCLDVCGHEISHGLTGNTAKLIYNNESGALNESYSDIFGTCIENYARPGNWNWQLGEDLDLNLVPLRDMSNPGLYAQPDTYKGTNWYNGTQDNGGVHYNSGVSNFWFYLLSTGGTGTNDLSNIYSVSALGMQAAAKIAFRALTVYYTPNINYAIARDLSIQAAKDLFGTCSNEMIQTMNAWHAVGVGQKYAAAIVAPDFKSDFTAFCNVPATIQFSNTTSNALTYTWDFGDGSAVATTTNASHIYTAAGIYNVKLKAINCAGTKDSITKSSFVVIDLPALPAVGQTVNVCENSQAVLNATATGVIKWYDSPTATLVAGAGNSFTTPVLNAGKTYYVANTIASPSSTGGILFVNGGGTVSTGTQTMIFDVIRTCTLQSVIAQAGVTGTRTIEVRNSANALISSVTVNFTNTNPKTCTLNFALTPGTNYRIGLSAASTGSLYRSDAGVSYPYKIGDCLSITGSSGGAGLYYWFYKWIVMKEPCSSELVPVTVIVDACTGISEKKSSDAAFGIFPNPARESIVVKTTELPEGLSVIITDATGRLVCSKKMFTSEESIDVGHLSKGIYFLSIRNANSITVRNFKIMKE